MENLNKWKKNYWMFVGINKSKYGWCKDEFKNIQSLKSEKGLWADDEEIELPRNSDRGHIDSFKHLFEKINLNYNILKYFPFKFKKCVYNSFIFFANRASSF